MENQPPEVISGPHSKASEQQNRNTLLREWLLRFSINADKALDADAISGFTSLWLEAFADLSDAVLESAFKKTLVTCKFWPVKIADVREHIEKAEDSRCEDEWQGLLDYCSKHVYADLGMAGAPKLPADIAHAADAAGGLRYLESCSSEELPWRKKDFIADLQRQRTSGDIAALLGPSPLGKMLEATAVRLSLPAATEPKHDTRPVIEVLRSMRDASPEQPHTVDRPNDPAFVAWQERQAKTDPVLAEYLKAHKLSNKASEASAR